MALRKMVYDGDEILRKKCRDVIDFNERLWVLLDDMADTMMEYNGVGLAAPQVGVIRRAVVIDAGENNIIEMVNPRIVSTEDEQTGTEGCLSLPGKCGIVTRPMKVTAEFQDRKGEWMTITGEGLTARAICHEIDHLDGILFKDIAEKMLTEEEIEELERRKGDS